MKENFDGADFALFAIISWNIWYCRNKAIRGEREPEPSGFISWCFDYWSRYFYENGQVKNYLAPKHKTMWEPPPPRTVKINVDAGEQRDAQEGSFCWNTAAVARDSMGTVLRWCTRMVHQPISPLAAELIAIKEGVKMGRFWGLENFWVESDCEADVSLINGATIPCCDVEGIIIDIKQLLSVSGCNGVRTVKRDGNSLAHSLAKGSFVNGSNCVSSGGVIFFGFVAI